MTHEQELLDRILSAFDTIRTSTKDDTGKMLALLAALLRSHALASPRTETARRRPRAL